MDLFTYADLQEQQPEIECDHLPVQDRYFTDHHLVCGHCHKILRAK